MKLAQIFITILLTTAATQAATVKSTQKIQLGDSEVSVNIYENTGANITFFAPHHN